jgi:DNA-binding transcriptional regulator YhcF (GntR family)
VKSKLDGDKPIYIQIKDGIEDDILHGRLKPDEAIPSNSQIVSFYGVNPITVLKGVDMLVELGIVYKKRGLGVYVSPDAPELLRQKARTNFVRERVEPLTRLCVPLEIGLDELHEMIDAAWRENT